MNTSRIRPPTETRILDLRGSPVTHAKRAGRSGARGASLKSSERSSRSRRRGASAGEFGQVTKQRVHPGDLIGGALTSCAATARQQRWERVKLVGALQFVGVAACERERFLEQLLDGAQPPVGVR